MKRLLVIGGSMDGQRVDLVSTDSIGAGIRTIEGELYRIFRLATVYGQDYELFVLDGVCPIQALIEGYKS